MAMDDLIIVRDVATFCDSEWADLLVKAVAGLMLLKWTTLSGWWTIGRARALVAWATSPAPEPPFTDLEKAVLEAAGKGAWDDGGAALVSGPLSVRVALNGCLTVSAGKESVSAEMSPRALDRLKELMAAAKATHEATAATLKREAAMATLKAGKGAA